MGGIIKIIIIITIIVIIILIDNKNNFYCTNLQSVGEKHAHRITVWFLVLTTMVRMVKSGERERFGLPTHKQSWYTSTLM